ncbi:MAG: YjbE family putative metal transport protein [Gammaproteobacteria bacterium]|nr:YjbE family putative metal transport protein [Gammaproteobacteria bacterium]
MELLDSFYKLVQVILVDLVLAGDNAIVIGLVAARFTKDYRRKVIFYGVGVAVLLRIIFALLTVQLLQIQGLLLFGGVLLLWICWKLWQELRTPVALPEELDEDGEVKETPPLLSAISQIIIADLSMSLDNVIAVAGVADGNNTILVIGLTLSIVFMTVAASFLANVLQKHRWIGYAGLVVILYVSIKMITEGYIQIFG